MRSSARRCMGTPLFRTRRGAASVSSSCGLGCRPRSVGPLRTATGLSASGAGPLGSAAAGVVAARRARQARAGADHEAGAALRAWRARVGQGAQGCRRVAVERGGAAALDLGGQHAELVLRVDVEET